MSRAGIVALALLVGFLAYRVALNTQPSNERMVSTTESGSLAPIGVSVEFDLLTGLPNSPDHFYLTPIEGWNRAFSHWMGSLLVGLITVVIVTWVLGRRQRRAARMPSPT